ncbi:MAG: RNA polymerase sigma factor [Planctomycetota bacterium]|jgi:RNA polymerase sigma-70 factor (ECF subfamily)
MGRVQTAGSESGIDLGAYSQLADGELISKLLRRDAEAWNELVVRYQRLVYAQIVKALPRKTGRLDEGLIEDVLADVFLGLLQNDLAALRGFKGDCKLSTWLCVIARRVAWRHAAKLPRERQLIGISDSSMQVDLGITIEVDSLAKLIGTENKLKLTECLEQMKSADRRILEMYYHEQLDYREIGRQLGLSINAVGPKLSRAHARLRKLMGKE